MTYARGGTKWHKMARFQGGEGGKERLFRRAGILSQEDMYKVEEAIKIQLDIN